MGIGLGYPKQADRQVSNQSVMRACMHMQARAAAAAAAPVPSDGGSPGERARAEPTKRNETKLLRAVGRERGAPKAKALRIWAPADGPQLVSASEF